MLLRRLGTVSAHTVDAVTDQLTRARHAMHFVFFLVVQQNVSEHVDFFCVTLCVVRSCRQINRTAEAIPSDDEILQTVVVLFRHYGCVQRQRAAAARA